MARDRSAFDDLVSEHSGALRQFLERRVPIEGVDDLTQEVWLAAWSALPTFDRRSAFQTWLCSIGLNKVRDYYRRDRRQASEVPLHESEHQVELRDHGHAIELRDSVRSMVSKLPAQQREVVELYYCCEYTLPEVARATGRNLNTVKYQFYSAHSQLATMMRRERP
jgi:RNA polymerase sigma-70 factor (ECF subfamily)